jgi:hypothetical protein
MLNNSSLRRPCLIPLGIGKTPKAVMNLLNPLSLILSRRTIFRLVLAAVQACLIKGS